MHRAGSDRRSRPTYLLTAGHQVLGLVRSDAAAAVVISLGAEVLRGSLDDLESLREGAAACEGVVHLGYNHDFSQMAEAAQTDLAAIEALGEALVDTGRPFVVASGVLGLATGRIATELDVPESDLPAIRESLVCTVIGRSRGSLVKCAFRADCPRRR